MVELQRAGIAERQRQHSRQHEQKQRQLLEPGGEDGSPASVLNAIGGQHTLHDELVRTPVPDGQDGRAEQDAGPRELRVVDAAPEAEGLRLNRRLQSFPAFYCIETDQRDRNGAAQKDEHLHHVRVEHRPQAAPSGVEAGQRHDGQRPPPERNAHQGLEHDAAGGHRYGDLGEHIADHGNQRQIGARPARVALLQELRHREHARAQVKRREQPPQQKQGEGREDFKLGYRHALHGGGAGQPYEVLGADIGGEDRGAHHKPADVAPGQEKLGPAALALAAHGPGHPQNQAQIGPHNQPVET